MHNQRKKLFKRTLTQTFVCIINFRTDGQHQINNTVKYICKSGRMIMKHDNIAMLRAWWFSSSIGCVCTHSTEGNDRRMEMYTTSTSMQNIVSNLTSPLLGLISSSACMEGGPVNTTSWSV